MRTSRPTAVNARLVGDAPSRVQGAHATLSSPGSSRDGLRGEAAAVCNGFLVENAVSLVVPFLANAASTRSGYVRDSATNAGSDVASSTNRSIWSRCNDLIKRASDGSGEPCTVITVRGSPTEPRVATARKSHVRRRRGTWTTVAVPP